jgi:hypothetical protein
VFVNNDDITEDVIYENWVTKYGYTLYIISCITYRFELHATSVMVGIKKMCIHFSSSHS